MKYLIMCEGANEKKIIGKSPMVMGQLRIYSGDVEIWRVGDKQTDQLRIPPEFRKQIKKVTKYCTLPELEILLILSEKKFREYEKRKSQKHPKAFAKEHIAFHGRKYKGDTDFYEAYYGKDIDKLVAAIREYKQRNHSHESDEHYLAEILES